MKAIADSVWQTAVADDTSLGGRIGNASDVLIDREKFAEASGLGIVTADSDGKVTSWNRAAERIFGIARDIALGQSMEIIIPERFRAAHRAGIQRIAAGGTSSLLGQTIEVIAIKADGSEFPIALSLTSWKSEEVVHFGAFILDISERRSAEMKLEHRAKHDQLTRLLGQQAFQAELRAAMAENNPVALITFDLDGFKNINDSLGHAVGDALLQSLAVRLRAIAEPSWIIGRLGGDEFAIAVETDATPHEILLLARKLLKSLSGQFNVAGHQLHLFASLGIAFAPVDSSDPDELMTLADRAMLQAKRRGGRKVRLFDQTMRAEITARRMLSDALRTAQHANEWELLFQPQFDLRDLECVGAEALLRWRHPEWGLMKPSAFLPVLETHSVAYEVGQWVLAESCRRLVEWRKAGLAIPRVSCNLFAAQFHSSALADRVLQELANNDLQPSDLELEITETIALKLDKTSLHPLFELKESGVGVALDDFGTGFASLTTLTRAPITQLKIDRRFVKNIVADDHSSAVVAGMVAISERLKVGLIAEGVETSDQADQLRAMGCNVVQGYLFGQPMNAKEFETVIGNSKQACASTADKGS